MNKLRRSILYVPGNNPGMIRDAHIYGSDAIMLDLEDSVALSEKDAARFLVYNALKTLTFGGKEVIVRINGLDTDYGLKDLEAIVRVQPDIIRLPKTESAQDIIACEKEIERIEVSSGLPVGKIKMMAAIESAEGVLNAREIAHASKRLVGIALGAEDFTADLKTSRSADGIELLTARSMIVMAARSARIDAFDTVYSDINNIDGFINEVKLIKQLGFDGKSVINPNQIKPLHAVYTPTKTEIEKSLAIVEAMEEAKKKGSGVISLNGKMIDKPILDRALHLLDLAGSTNVLRRAMP